MPTTLSNALPIIALVWSLIHDPLMFAGYWLFTNKLHWIRTRESTDQRLDRLERVLTQHLKLHHQRALKDTNE